MKACKGSQAWNRGQITSIRGWRKDPEEREIGRKYVWSYNEEGREGKPIRKESEWFRELVAVGAGRTISVGAGAPGYGYVKYLITRITKTRVFGHIVEDTIRILEPGDVI